MKNNILIILCVLLACSCVKEAQSVQALPPISPDYTDVTVPVNIAPLNFTLEGASHVSAVFSCGDKSFKCAGKEIQIPVGRWHKFLSGACGKNVSVKVCATIDGKSYEYLPFEFAVSSDVVDPYLAYRLIEPGYEIWNQMGLYQRNVTNFKQTEIITNKMTGGNCMNCHTFCNKDPHMMLFHMRSTNGGTYFVCNREAEKLNTKTPQTISALVYPQWHPSGKYVAFSTNSTAQVFHTADPNRIEVYDSASDVVVYDVENHEIVSCPQLKGVPYETYPTFSADGRTLYFCSSPFVVTPYFYENVHYSLCSIAFDPDTRSFGTSVDTLYNARTQGGSVSLPRVSPDGRFLMYTLQSYGNFGIWHKDADEWIIDLVTGENRPATAANSSDVDSYHSWSSNGRWVVLSSRRDDKLYTRLYLAHIDADGVAAKAFLLPQRSSAYYKGLLKSYNIPEFITGPVQLDQYKVSQIAKKDPGVNLTFVGN